MSSRATKLKHTQHPWLPRRLAKAADVRQQGLQCACRLEVRPLCRGMTTLLQHPLGAKDGQGSRAREDPGSGGVA